MIKMEIRARGECNLDYRMKCDVCKEYYRLDDHVFLDKWNTILHAYCHNHKDYSVKDRGTYEEIIYKYSFGQMLRPLIMKGETKEFLFVPSGLKKRR
jgi:hypothetical protein